MESTNLLVSFRTTPQQRELINKSLVDRCAISYLDEVTDREAAIRSAQVILAWNPPKEFSHAEYSLMGNVRFMQLLSAGADHVPFDLLPEGLVVAGNVGAYAKPMAEHVMALTLALAKN